MLALCALLAGCASTLPANQPTATGGQSATGSRLYHDAIDMNGRMSVRYQQNGAEQAVHGSFNWSQNPQRTQVTLLTPLGQTLAVIDITPEASTLTQNGQAPRTAANVDALVAEALGWPLPVAGLRNWLQGFGIAADGNPFVATPQDNANDIKTRDGWRIQYAAWNDRSDPSAQNRPRRIDLERFTAEAGNVAIRIVIDGWQPR